MRSSALFAALPEEERAAIAPHLVLRRFAAGHEIVREGEPGDTCYLIARGTAGVFTHDVIGQSVPLRVFRPGDTFGEMALVTQAPRTATVRSLSAVEAYEIGRAAFTALTARCPRFAARVHAYVDLLAVDAFLKKSSPFAPLPPRVVARIAGALLAIPAEAGEVIVTEGEPGTTFFLIRSGRVEVTRRGERVTTLEAGDCFGEVALVTGGTRIATVRALEDTDLLVLEKSEFDAIVRTQPAFASRARELARIRLGATTGRLLRLVDPVATLMPHLRAGEGRRYWLLLIVGIAAFAAASIAAARTEQLLAVYAALVLGSFVMPVVYVVYLAEADLLATRVTTVALTFVLGAALGLPVAILAEQSLAVQPGAILPALTIAVIEETAKVLGVLWLLRRAQARFQMDGVIFGAAAGMGFAAFETMLFGLGRVEAVGQVLALLWVRTLLAPLGHGTWTAIVCAAIWRTKGSGAARLDREVAAALLFVIGLHTLWDWQPVTGRFGLLAFFAIGAAGLLTLRALVRQAGAEQAGAVVSLNPEVAAAGPGGAQATCGRCGQRSLTGSHYCVRCGSVLKADPRGLRRPGSS